MARVFTLEEARAVLPKVQALTRPVFEMASNTARSGMCAIIWFSRSIAVSGVSTCPSGKPA